MYYANIIGVLIFLTAKWKRAVTGSKNEIWASGKKTKADQNYKWKKELAEPPKIAQINYEPLRSLSMAG